MKKIGITSATAKHTKNGPSLKTDKAYVEYVEEAGFMPIVLPILNDFDNIDELIKDLDGIIFAGGYPICPLLYGENPIPEMEEYEIDRDLFELELYKRAKKAKIKIIGICRGMSLINISEKGSMWQNLDIQRPTNIRHSPIDIRNDRYLFMNILDEKLKSVYKSDRVIVNTLHKQASKKLAYGLNILAISDDNTIQAIATDDRMVYGFQFHPERIIEKLDKVNLVYEVFEGELS